jgi:hypothetical protein
MNMRVLLDRRTSFRVKLKGEAGPFLETLRNRECRVEETEDGIVKVYLPQTLGRRDLFGLAADVGVQIRHFVKSRTSLEDLFARTVGVD